jgi:hypothetical protein
MSAFIVEDKTINKIVSKIYLDRDGDWLKRKFKDAGYDLDISNQRSKLAWDMFKLNIRAVNMRYEDKPADQFRPLNFKPALEANYTMISCIKSIKCWMYQCSEGDCDQSELFKLMECVCDSWMYKVVSSLPEYEKSVWN